MDCLDCALPVDCLLCARCFSAPDETAPPSPCLSCRPTPGECETCSQRPPTPPDPSDLLVRARLLADNLAAILPPPHPLMAAACEAAGVTLTDSPKEA